MKEIKLTQGKVALVDDEDFQYLNQFKWYAHKKHINYYAYSYINNKKILMHRLILKTPNNLIVDHIDHNGLNNQKSNLRNCTYLENAKNKVSTGDCKYLGVTKLTRKYKNKIYNYYQVYIQIDYMPYYAGCFNNYIDATKRYNRLAKRFHKEFANLNIF